MGAEAGPGTICRRGGPDNSVGRIRTRRHPAGATGGDAEGIVVVAVGVAPVAGSAWHVVEAAGDGTVVGSNEMDGSVRFGNQRRTSPLP
jgi:hypothetical protein